MIESFGARLKAQRERQQVTLEAIAERTKIRVGLLEGLEQDDLTKWPGGIFRRAYVRNYAGAIGLDPESTVREFLALYPLPEEASPAAVLAEAEASKATHRPKTRLHYLLASAIGAVAKPAEPERTTASHVAAERSVPDAGPAAIAHDTAGQNAVPAADVVLDADEGVVANSVEDVLDAGVTAVELDGELELEPLDGGSEHPAPVQADLASLAALCSRIVEARSASDLEGLLGEAAGMLNAVGIIMWPWDAARGVLVPTLSHGYPRRTLAKLPTVPPDAANPIGAAFRSSTRQVLAGSGSATSAIVVPMTTPSGCTGVLAVECANGVEQDEAVQALATILAAPLSLAMQHLHVEPASRHAIA